MTHRIVDGEREAPRPSAAATSSRTSFAIEDCT